MHVCGWMVHPERRGRLQTQLGFGAAGAPSGDFQNHLCIPTAASCSSEKAFELNRNNYFDLAIPEGILPSAQTPSSILCLKSGDNQTTKQILCKYHYLIYLFYFVPLLFFFFSILAVMKEQKTPTMLGLLTTCDLLGSCTSGTFNSSRNSSRMRHWAPDTEGGIFVSWVMREWGLVSL